MTRSPLKRTSGLARRTPLRSTSTLRPGKPLKRTRMRRASPRRLKLRATHAPFVRFVRHLSCANCFRRGPSDAAHMTLGPNEKSMGSKVDDRQCVPLCRQCHRYFDGQADGPGNPFRGWSKDERWAFAAELVRQTQLATIPEDLDSAYELERWGLGTVLRQVAGEGWAWKPGSSSHTESAP